MSKLDDTCDEDRLVEAVKAFTQRLDHGDQVSVDEFVRDYADIESELRPALEGLLLVRMAEPPVDATPKSDDQEITTKPIGDFQIIGELGRGGMGVVYEAVQLSLGRKVALKVLPFASGLDEVRLQRFRNEAHAAAALHHTNIVPVYAVGSDRGIHYYAMQLIEGETLAQVIAELQASDATVSAKAASSTRAETVGANETSNVRTDTLTSRGRKNQFGLTTTFASQADRLKHFRSASEMIRDAAMAIDHAHAYGVIHRDIKPGNLIRDRVGKIWVTDFGLAQVESEASQLTRSGDPMGTLRYMSPEQAAGNRTILDHRTDIYSLGVTLYELLVLQPAFDGENYRELLNLVVDREPLSPRVLDPTLPIELDTIVRKAMSKSPVDRYQSAKALADDLQRWLDDKPIAARPPNLLERVNKWRRRNSGLVAAASAILLVTTVSLAVTSLIVWRQQLLTSAALDAETSQRQLAERNFAQARDAVDTFSELSERELAYRPDLQDLRRTFLETSLDFYQNFLAQSSDDEEVSEELQATADQVERMVEELQVLENVQPLLQLVHSEVRDDLTLDPEVAESIVAAIGEFQTARDALANQFVGGLVADNEAMSDLLRQFDAFVTEQLQPWQLERLRQISRQRRLPFTFRSREVVKALQLTGQQQLDIARIIEETRPGPGRGRPEGPHEPRFDFRSRVRGLGPPWRGGPDDGPGGPERRGGPGRPYRPGGLGPEPMRRPLDGQPPAELGRTPPLGDPSFVVKAPPPGTERTIQEILKLLSDEQRATWSQLLGEPFRWQR